MHRVVWLSVLFSSLLFSSLLFSSPALAQSIAAPAAPEPTGPRLRLTGFAHFDYVHRQSSVNQISSAGEPLNEDRFLLRRARLKALFEYRILSGTLELDVNTVRGSQARPIGVDVSLRWPPRRRCSRRRRTST